MPFICKHQPADLPHGYTLIRICQRGMARHYLVFCEATGKFVASRRHYEDQRAAVLAARRSAWMVAYNRICAAA